MADTTQPAATHLTSSAWRLVKIMSMDDSDYEPDDRLKYTLEFDENGDVALQSDCNQTAIMVLEDGIQNMSGTYNSDQLQAPVFSVYQIQFLTSIWLSSTGCAAMSWKMGTCSWQPWLTVRSLSLSR